MTKTVQVLVIRVDGSEEQHRLPAQGVFRMIESLIGAGGIDGIVLRDGRTMFVDDYGYETVAIEHAATPTTPFTLELRPTKARKPVNLRATALYHGICLPGITHAVVGDVAIVSDEDFG